MTTRLTSHLLALAAATSLVTAARADDWTSSKEVADAARGLADAAKGLHKSIRAVAEDTPLVKEIDQVAGSAQKLHESVKMGATYEASVKEFGILSKGYNHFRAGLEKAHDAHHDEAVAADAKRVKAAYDHLRAHIEGRREPKPAPTPAPTPSRPGH